MDRELFEAARCGDSGAIKLLFENGAKINEFVPEYDEPEAQNITPLQVATVSCNYDAVQTLLSLGADVKLSYGSKIYGDACVSKTSREFNLAQHLCAMRTRSDSDAEYTEIMELLLDAGAEVDALGEDSCPALVSAAFFDSIKMVELLVRHGSSLDKYGTEALLNATRATLRDGGLVVSRFLLAKGCRLRSRRDQMEALRNAAASDNIELLDLLFESHSPDIFVDPTCSDFPVASETSLLYFLNRGFHVDAIDESGNTALIKAAVSNHTNCVKILISHGADVIAKNKSGRTPLHFAAERLLLCNHETRGAFAILLDNGADPTITDDQGFTALHYVPRSYMAGVLKEIPEQDREAVSSFIEYGGDVNAQTLRGDTAAHIASQYTLSQLVELLASFGANLDLKNLKHMTPLHEICASRDFIGNRGTLKALLGAGANVYAMDEKQRTPLHLAILNRVTERNLDTGGISLDTLIDAYETIDMKDMDGKTALDLALATGAVKCAAKLERKTRNMTTNERPVATATSRRASSL
ncbi:MAG: hypothetical protein M1820_001241 [Bogoriella megaspora]|nr:MAG: hypothetical protein M1820_001241 [Bogoriella megaspora]